MLRNLKKSEKGFTIIEVLIVLAIAGLIMVVVFLAVPALQRNQRNSTYRTEANNISSAYQEVSSNKNGAVLTASGSGTANSDAAKVLSSSNAKSITTVTIEAEAGTTTPANNTYDRAVIRTGAKCTAPDGHGTDPGSTRQIAILFNVETSGGSQAQCINS